MYVFRLFLAPDVAVEGQKVKHVLLFLLVVVIVYCY